MNNTILDNISMILSWVALAFMYLGPELMTRGSKIKNDILFKFGKFLKITGNILFPITIIVDILLFFNII